MSCTSSGGYNSLYNNSYKDIYAFWHCDIDAENNFWNPNPPKLYASGYSSIDYTPSLPSNPNTIQNSTPNTSTPEEVLFTQAFEGENTFGVGTKDKKYNYDKKWPIEWKLLYARNLIFVEDYGYAQEILMDVIEENPDSTKSLNALCLLWQASRKHDTNKFTDFLQKSVDKMKLSNLYGAMDLILVDYEDTNRKKTNKHDATIQKYKSKKTEELTLFDKFMHNLFEMKDPIAARIVSDELDKQFPKSNTALEAHRFLGDDVKETKEEKGEFVKENNIEKSDDLLPEKYELLGNYPNPFNPSTTIKYALPYNSNVELTIYDLSGKEIKSFIVNSQSSGYANVVWNGTNNNGTQVTSGVYIYKFKAVSLEGEGQIFEKSSKLMLLK